MRSVLIIISILLPILGGVRLLVSAPKTKTGRRIWCELVTCAASVLVWIVILGGTVDSFTVYSFTRGYRIAFQLDGLGMLFAGMVSLMWPFVTLYAYEYMEHAEHKNMFFAFYIMTYGVALGVCFAGNVLTLYVFYEMLSLVTIPLVTHYQDSESMYAGRVYAGYVIGGAAAALITVMVTTMYAIPSFTLGGHSFHELPQNFMLLIYLIGFFGFGVKAAVMPFHRWLPTASVAPTPVTALLHAVAVVNSGVFAIMRLTWYVFSPQTLAGTWAQKVAVTVSFVTLTAAAARALKERHFKRRLAYSTVSNLSYMLFGVMLLNPAGFAAGMAHMLFHGVIKMSLFLCAGAFMHQSGRSYVYEINGAGRKMPLTFTFYTLGALSLTGIPMFCGFISKWNLLLAGAQAGTIYSYIGTACLIVAAFFCAIYTLSVSLRAFFPVSDENRWKEKELSDPGWRMLLPIGVFTAVNVLLGIFPGPVMEFLGKIAAGLI